ncbi:hypothetical protein QNH39_04120 [Neobacillus novalis]|uniref:Uncharacterized protein n=1 Tax=Neobacillus novalis TaxID=220687 RepID=A0AA95SHJ9_9BACI|nr:hypothetical protein [Neobacillus novalis]WHY87056.1 hypothetical protein QNH39_04120 [Neobacillus novalis]
MKIVMQEGLPIVNKMRNQHGLINKRRNFSYLGKSTENSLNRRKDSDYLLEKRENG